ncbi:hypothetical protein [Arcicella rosea]|uniref:Uncharacterized protein n=1 Tax=Arcicella rosea TaxID=502909 RepID=A0A841EXD0_9BACT|nr:hypothetical protein [Arcicella rosea]MBB6005743.1 hypothetical protein [Arcicella rosea]
MKTFHILLSFLFLLVTCKSKDVEPIEQKKIIPEMNEKAFWVTAKINLTCNYHAFKNVSGEVRFKYRIITL